MKVIVSACLLGENCKYNGGNNFKEHVAAFTEGKDVVMICPEVLGGLGTPRVPVEIAGDKAINKEGEDVTEQFARGVALAMQQVDEILKYEDIDCAVLQSRSPTCGVHARYDGTFTKTLVQKAGLFAQALKDAGIKVIDAEDLL